MTPATRWRLALRLLGRDWRAGELRILAAAIVIAVAASTAIGFFTDRLGRGMVNQSADFLGADLALVSPRPVDAAWLAQARAQGLQVSESLEFASVVVSGDALQLASVRAVDSAFPLRGSLRIAPQPFVTDMPAAGIPAPGGAWTARAPRRRRRRRGARSRRRPRRSAGTNPWFASFPFPQAYRPPPPLSSRSSERYNRVGWLPSARVWMAICSSRSSPNALNRQLIN